ncbi:cache domain-containing sensor histidine kinase [Paenibacillus sp. MMO-58]|uniref:cache domain-containing sensor histidine kinase n=1 Tax=Paenibacillus sp. MMO-58 TaxID=3081290 RepID=UPI003016153F
MIKRLLQTWYLNLPIRYKILLWFVPLLIVTITVTGIFAYRIASSEIVKKMEVKQQSTAQQAVDHLDYIAQDALDISNYLFLTPEIQALLRSKPETGIFVTNQNVIDSINRLMVTRPYFQFLTIYSDHFAPLQFNNKGLSAAIPFEEYKRLYNYKTILANPQIETWSMELPGSKKSIFTGDTKSKLLLTKVMKDNTTYEPQGVLLLGIDEKDIRSSYTSSADDLAIAVINTDGTVLSDSTGQWVGRPMQQLPYLDSNVKSVADAGHSIHARDWVFAERTSALTGWKVIVIQPRSELVAELNRIMLVTVSVIIATLLLSLVFSWAIAGFIIRPLRSILASMKKFQKGSFDEYVPLKGMDEIGQLGAGYNKMVGRIRTLIDEMYTAQLKQKNAELKLLQSQINPHFLYNTLNTIAWTAERNGDKTVGEMIYSMSSIFKISLSQGRDAIELFSEFELIEHYLFLQQIRFKDRLTCELELAAELKDYLIPKLLLQPLIENAVVHGVEPLQDEGGFIHVEASLAGNMVVIEITDNGIGIPQDKLAVLQRQLKEGTTPEGSDSYALSNIAERVRIFYGEEASIAIQSTTGLGTRVLLTLPAKRR